MPNLQQSFARLAAMDTPPSLNEANAVLRENGIKLSNLHGGSDHSEHILYQQKIALSYVLSLMQDHRTEDAETFLQYWHDDAIDSIALTFPDAPSELFDTLYQRD